MPRIDIGDIRLNWSEWGAGEETLVFIHGNLSCGHWFDLIGPRLPQRFRAVAIDWRGCGDSDKPEPTAGYANYSLEQHAADMLAALRGLGIERCHLINHSTGGLICLHMLRSDPERFGKVLALDPVGPMGLRFAPEHIAAFAIMKASKDKTRRGLALIASTLFRPETLKPKVEPVFADHVTPEQKALFARLVELTFGVSDGVWFGTATHLNHAYQTGADGLRDRQGEIGHEHLLLWGAFDPFVPRSDMEEMVQRMPRCRLAVEPEVGHSMLLERPEMFVRYLTEFF